MRIGRLRSTGHGLLTVVKETKVTRTARFRRGGVELELCIAAGRSPLNTWTITEADSVRQNRKYSYTLLLLNLRINSVKS